MYLVDKFNPTILYLTPILKGAEIEMIESLINVGVHHPKLFNIAKMLVTKEESQVCNDRE